MSIEHIIMDSWYEVFCDDCHKVLQDEMGCNEISTQAAGAADKALKSGWKVNEIGMIICPDCQKKE